VEGRRCGHVYSVARGPRRTPLAAASISSRVSRAGKPPESVRRKPRNQSSRRFQHQRPVDDRGDTRGIAPTKSGRPEPSTKRTAHARCPLSRGEGAVRGSRSSTRPPGLAFSGVIPRFSSWAQ
jgi:hypothetical protein